jgi:hypothetical protein
MSVSFQVFDPKADGFVGETVPMGFGTAARVGDLLGITFVTSTEAEGECTLVQLRTGLERFPEGHPDPLIGQRMAELLRLLLAAEARDPALPIYWC